MRARARRAARTRASVRAHRRRVGWHAQARRKYNVKYPTLYAPDSHPSADAFNSVQRAHQNTLETWAPVMLLMLGVGVPAPREAASCGLLWVLGRFAYGAGYAAKGPEGRLLGFMAATFGGQFPLIGLAAYHGAKMAAVLRAA